MLGGPDSAFPPFILRSRVELCQVAGFCEAGLQKTPFGQCMAVYTPHGKYWSRLFRPTRPNSSPPGATETAELPEVPDSWSRLRKKSWARLLKKVFAVDPFLCPKCGGTMLVAGVIEDPVKLKAIIEWAGLSETGSPEVRGPPLLGV